MTIAAFARAAGVTRAAVQQWERLGGTAPAARRREAVTRLLGMTVAQFNSGGPQPPLRLKRHHAVRVVSDVEAGGYAKIDNFAATPAA